MVIFSPSGLDVAQTSQHEDMGLALSRANLKHGQRLNKIDHKVSTDVKFFSFLRRRHRENAVQPLRFVVP
eukprot:3924012-Pleurochrysis_carterae.AAC.1